MGQYRIMTSPPQKLINIKVEGIFDISDAEHFIIDFNREITKLHPSEYTLHFDCTYLGVTSATTLFKLEECFVLYRKAGFLNVTFDTGGNSILRTQLENLSKLSKLERYKVF